MSFEEYTIEKGPRGAASSQPVSPGFGMTGPYPRPGTEGARRPTTSPVSGQGTRALVTLPQGLTTDDAKYMRPQPPNYIEDVNETNFFSPLNPVWPYGPPYVTDPREWDYPVGINLEYQSRHSMACDMLRTVAKSWGVLATVIEARIDELVAMKWSFQLREDSSTGKRPDSSADPRCQMLNQFFRKPDRKRHYPMWMRMIFRDRYVIDGASTYINRNRGGTPYSIDVLDGATIKPLIDDAGRRPDWPQPAYQQIIKGLPMNNFTEQEILYMPARPRSELPIYGYSEVSQVLMEATEGIRKTLYQLNFWQEGTIPDIMLGVPELWTPEQIAMWQASFDALLSGNLELKSKVRFVPGGMKPFEMKGSAGELLKCDYDEWITRIICFAFRIMPKPFVKEAQSRASAETEKDNIVEQGLQAEMTWWKCYMDELKEMGWGPSFDDIEFSYIVDDETSPELQEQILSAYVKMGIMNVDEARDQIGLEPVQGGDVNMIYIATGAVLLEDMANGQIQQNAEAALAKPAAGPPGKGGAVAKVASPLAQPRRIFY